MFDALLLALVSTMTSCKTLQYKKDTSTMTRSGRHPMVYFPNRCSSSPSTIGGTMSLLYAVALAACLAAVFVGACSRATQSEGAAGSPVPQGPGKISGTVTASDTGEPVAYVQVVVFDLEGNQAAPPGNTLIDGSYEIEVQPGKYRIVANIVNPAHPLGWNGFAPMWNGGKPVDDPAAIVEVQPGEHKRLDFKLLRVRSVKGKVKTSDGGPILEGANVSAIEASTSRFFAQTSIASDGSYEILLPDGSWFLQFTVPGYVQRISLKVLVEGAPLEVQKA